MKNTLLLSLFLLLSVSCVKEEKEDISGIWLVNYYLIDGETISGNGSNLSFCDDLDGGGGERDTVDSWVGSYRYDLNESTSKLTITDFDTVGIMSNGVWNVEQLTSKSFIINKYEVGKASSIVMRK